MSQVSFSENHEANLISYEAGEPLVSLRDPRGQGLKWVYSLGAIPADEVVIVGLGSGFHVAALADVDVDLKITVVETREALLPIFRAQFPELSDRVQVVIVQKADDILKSDFFAEVPKRTPYVLSFTECWGQQSETFIDIFAHLTGRSLESVRYHFNEFGINIKSTLKADGNLYSLKDVMPNIEGSTMPESNKQLFRVLSELVK